MKPIVNAAPRQGRRNVGQMGMNMIFVPMPIINYSWGYNPYMMQQHFFYSPSQITNPFVFSNFNNMSNQLSG